MTNRASRLFTGALAAAKARLLCLVAFFFAVLIPLIPFGELAEEVVEGKGLPFDEPILRWFHTHATPARDRWVIAITRLGAPVPMLICEAVAIAALLVVRKRRAAGFLAVASGGAALLNVCAKLFFGRQRPQLGDDYHGEKLLVSERPFDREHELRCCDQPPCMAHALALAGRHWRDVFRAHHQPYKALPRRALSVGRGRWLVRGARVGLWSLHDSPLASATIAPGSLARGERVSLRLLLHAQLTSSLAAAFLTHGNGFLPGSRTRAKPPGEDTQLMIPAFQ